MMTPIWKCQGCCKVAQTMELKLWQLQDGSNHATRLLPPWMKVVQPPQKVVQGCCNLATTLQECCNHAARLAFSYGWLQHPCKVVARLQQPCTTLCGGYTTFMQGGSNLVAWLLPSCHSFNSMVWAATLQQGWHFHIILVSLCRGVWLTRLASYHSPQFIHFMLIRTRTHTEHGWSCTCTV